MSIFGIYANIFEVFVKNAQDKSIGCVVKFRQKIF
jgi:hypothetical protein